MASWTSGAMSTSMTYVKYAITITENSTSVANNTSNVTVSVRFYRTNTGYQTWGTGTVYCKINGTQYSASVTPSQKIVNGTPTSGGIILFSKTLDIGHDSNGAKTLTCSAWINHDGPTSSEQSYSHALTTIPRASALSVGNGTLGSAQTITADRKSSSFTHTLTWESGSYSGTIADKSSATSWSFTPSLDLANGAPYGTDVYCAFTLTTYNGSTWVGSDTKAAWLHIPDSVKPTISSLTMSDANGYADTYGGYIQGQSKLNISISASGVYGSSISAYQTYFDGNRYDGQTFTSNTLTSSGSIQIDSYVYDTRNRWAEKKTEFVTVLAYSKPTAQFSLRRCDADGTENERGTYCQVQIRYSITSLSNQNTKSATLYYKKTDETVWTTVTITATNYEESNLVAIFPADDAYSYNVKLTVADAFASTTAAANLSTGYCLYHVPASGKGITFGGVAEDDGFNVKMDAHFYNGITEDIVVLNSGDCNALMASGNYYIGTSGTNKPGSGLNGWLTVKTYSTDYCYQEYVTYTGIRYHRLMSAGTWGAWTDHYDTGGKILWQGGLHMNANQSIELSERVKDQSNGIVLIFQSYDGGVKSWGINHCFVSKRAVTIHPGGHMSFFLTNEIGQVGVKGLVITDDDTTMKGKISGKENNTYQGTSNGITFANSYFVLTYVVGV